MKNIFGYTFQKLQKGGSLFKDNSSNITKLKSLISKIEKGQLPVSNPTDVKKKLQEIVSFQQGGRYDNGGLAQRSGTVRTQRSPAPNNGVVIDKYRGTRIDNAGVKSPYTMGGKAQSQSTINANNQEMETMDLGNYTSPEQIANDFKAGKLKRQQAQLLTQKLMNKYSDTDAFDAIRKGELKQGQSKNIGGYNFTLDQNNKLSADRSHLNSALGLDANLKYNTGEYKSNLEYQGTDTPKKEPWTPTTREVIQGGENLVQAKNPVTGELVFNRDGTPKMIKELRVAQDIRRDAEGNIISIKNVGQGFTGIDQIKSKQKTEGKRQ